MNGAREYAELLGTGKFGKLGFVSGQHARGKTFHVYLLDKEEGNPTIEVYGIVDGQPGWTESYGWLHTRKWIDDFNLLVESTKLGKKAILKAQKIRTNEEKSAELLRIQELLDKY
jgi:hypothetical protein